MLDKPVPCEGKLRRGRKIIATCGALTQHASRLCRSCRHLAYMDRARALARPKREPMRSPTPGSAEWAETRGDDLGESEDC
jgi:hypothetical protein